MTSQLPQEQQRHFSRLLLSIWKGIVRCSMIGGGLGLIAGIAGSLQQASGQPRTSMGINIVISIVGGVLMGVILLGVPVSIWTLLRWLIAGDRQVDKMSPAGLSAQRVAGDASHDAMIGATAVIPGAILGALAGVAIDAAIVGCIWFISIMTGARFWGAADNGWTFALGLVVVIGTVTGAAAGLFLGSVVGAIFGGVRGSRHTKSA